MAKEIKDTHLTLRISKNLKEEIQGIADEVKRSLNNAAELLLIKGIEAYKASEGVLVDARPKNSDPQGSINSEVNGSASSHLNIADACSNETAQDPPAAPATRPHRMRREPLHAADLTPDHLKKDKDDNGEDNKRRAK